MADEVSIPKAAVAEVNRFLLENPDLKAVIVSGQLVIGQGRDQRTRVPRFDLTDAMIASLPQTTKKFDTYRDVTEGLDLQVGKYRKTWKLRGSTGRSFKIGNYPEMSILEARAIVVNSLSV